MSEYYNRYLIKTYNKQKANFYWRRRTNSRALEFPTAKECKQLANKCQTFMDKHQLSLIGAWK